MLIINFFSLLKKMSKVEIYKDSVGEYRWRLVSGNGEIVAQGESYRFKSSVFTAVSRIKELFPSAVVIDRTVSR